MCACTAVLPAAVAAVAVRGSQLAAITCDGAVCTGDLPRNGQVPHNMQGQDPVLGRTRHAIWLGPFILAVAATSKGTDILLLIQPSPFSVKTSEVDGAVACLIPTENHALALMHDGRVLKIEADGVLLYHVIV